MSLAEILKKVSCKGKDTEIISVNKLLERYGNEVTITGFQYVTLKKTGEMVPVFRIAEGDGVRFWATSSHWVKTVVPYLEEKLGSAEAIDASFRAEPQRCRIEKMTTNGGKQFNSVRFLDDNEAEK